MASTGISAQNTTFSIEGTAGTNIMVTNVTNTLGAVVTGTNTLAVKDIVEIGTIVGMESLAGTLAIVTAATSSTFTLGGLDCSIFAAAGTSGPMTPKTWIRVNNIKDYAGFDGSVSDIDMSNFDSGAMEWRPGLQDFGQFAFNIDVDDSNLGQIAMRSAKTLAAVKGMRMVLPNARIRTFKGYMKKFTESGSVNGVIKAAIDIRITGVVTFG